MHVCNVTTAHLAVEMGAFGELPILPPNCLYGEKKKWNKVTPKHTRTHRQTDRESRLEVGTYWKGGQNTCSCLHAWTSMTKDHTNTHNILTS